MTDMEALVEGTAKALRYSELVKFAIAKDVAALRLSGTWREFTYPADHERAGQHPSSYKKFLEAYCQQVRDQGLELSAGGLDSLVDLYLWAEGVGLDDENMATFGQNLLKTIKASYGSEPNAVQRGAVQEAWAQLSTLGKVHLPSLRKPGAISVQMEVQVASDGDHILKSLTLVRDGTPYKNKWSPQMSHWLSKRLRAGITEREG